MKRVFLVLSFLVLFTFLCVTNVSASECSLKELRELKTLAKKVQVTYEFDEKNRVFNLNVYNVNSRVNLVGSFFEYSTNGAGLPYGIPGLNYSYSIVATNKTNCSGEELYVLKLKLPFYNEFSSYKQCMDYPEFDLCKKWYNSSEISEKDFGKKLLEYKKQNTKNKMGLLDYVYTFFIGNWRYFVILGSGFAVGLYIVSKKSKKNKIEL